jgi:hypothetical protein
MAEPVERVVIVQSLGRIRGEKVPATWSSFASPACTSELRAQQRGRKTNQIRFPRSPTFLHFHPVIHEVRGKYYSGPCLRNFAHPSRHVVTSRSADVTSQTLKCHHATCRKSHCTSCYTMRVIPTRYWLANEPNLGEFQAFVFTRTRGT